MEPEYEEQVDGDAGAFNAAAAGQPEPSPYERMNLSPVADSSGSNLRPEAGRAARGGGVAVVDRA